MAPSEASSSVTAPGWRRRARAAALVGLTVAATWVGLHLLVNRASVRERLHARAVEALHQRLPEAVVGEDEGVDWLFQAFVGPLTVPAAAPGAPPVLSVERLRVRPALWSLLSGRVEPSRVRAEGVRIAPGPGGRELLRLVERVRAARLSRRDTPPSAARAAFPVLEARRIVVEVLLGGRTVSLGPFSARLERASSGLEEVFEGLLSLPGGGALSGRVERHLTAAGPVPPVAGEPGHGAAQPAPAWSATARLAISAKDVPAELRRGGVAATAGQAALTVVAQGGETQVHARLQGSLDDLTLMGDALGPSPVGPLAMSGQAELDFDRRASRLTLLGGRLEPLGPLVLEAHGALDLLGDLPFSLEVTLPPVDFGALTAALPAALAPGPEAPRSAGAVSGRWRLGGPARRPIECTVEGDLDLAAVREQSRRAFASPLRATFTAHPAGDEATSVVVGPENPDFVPLSTLPDYVVRAITTSEDAGFFGHHGFDFAELKNAAAAAGQAGRLGRGGSTITQQLAKNLYLSRERTLSRKVKEAFITVALEATTSKARLLEIYLNVIEWGPSLHGIGPAARRYFGKEARMLTPREACFLAVAIPSPLRTSAAVAAGVPPQRFQARLDELLGKLGAVGVLTPEALEAALQEPLAFAGTASVAAPAAPTLQEDEEAYPGESAAPEPAPEARGGAAAP
jgi:penicillin-binding protein 1A